MDKNLFAERLSRASERARDFARTLVLEPLPDAIRFDVRLNCSYDGNPLHPDERVYPEDPERIPASRLSGLTQEEVVGLLWREGSVPEWVNLSVTSEDGEHTLIELSSCGRFTANERLLYHEREGYQPFHVLGPPEPSSIGFDGGERPRFSLYWNARVNSRQELARLQERSMHLETLVLSGPSLDDEALEELARAPLPALRSLRLEKTHIRGPGLRHFADVPLESLTWQADPALPIDLQPLERFSRLEDLEVEAQASPLEGVSALSALRGLKSLHLSAPAFTDLGVLRPLDSLETLYLSGTRVKSLEVLARFKRLDTLVLKGTAVEDEDLHALAGLPRLRALDLGETAVTDAAPAHLRKLPALRILVLDKTRAGDRVLKHLSHLNLRDVRLCDTQVTEEGVAWLRRRCRWLNIYSAFDQYTSPLSGRQWFEAHVRHLRSLLKRR